MPNKKTVKIVHPDLELEGEIVVSAISAWERNGWTVVDDGDSETATEQTPVEVPVNEKPEPIQPFVPKHPLTD